MNVVVSAHSLFSQKPISTATGNLEYSLWQETIAHVLWLSVYVEDYTVWSTKGTDQGKIITG